MGPLDRLTMAPDFFAFSSFSGQAAELTLCSLVVEYQWSHQRLFSLSAVACDVRKLNVDSVSHGRLNCGPICTQRSDNTASTLRLCWILSSCR
jgi:hypothetical protein